MLHASYITHISPYIITHINKLIMLTLLIL